MRSTAIIVMALLAALTACTEEQPAVRPHLAALRAAERSTAAAHSVRVESTTAMGEELSIEAEGALDWQDELVGTLTITYTGGTTAQTMRRLGVTSMEARYLPDAYYAHMGEKFAKQSGGRHWIRYAYDDLADLGDGTGATFAEQIRTSTPNQSVKLLLDCADVRRIGEETVRGRRAVHYSGTVAVDDVADAGLRRQLEQAGVTAQTVDLWVDDRGLLIKKAEKGELATGELTQTAHYSDYGVRVSTEAPPAEDTQDFKELLKKQGS
ncbi:hypothetical protein OHT76_25830 [Streptomyces sp. NBC_00287]|uniref:hypothetical protein n=1 Tax=Streptomyces sp. NBC_00287 TaxID=2975702 RepID=UPI002E294F71|nr:hypothetical protein [Streptomyces sp. NBC_00287]